MSIVQLSGGVRFHLKDGRRVTIRFKAGMAKVKIEGSELQVAPITRHTVKQLIIILHNAGDNIRPLKIRCGTGTKYVPPAARVREHTYTLNRDECDRLKKLLIYRVLPQL